MAVMEEFKGEEREEPGSLEVSFSYVKDIIPQITEEFATEADFDATATEGKIPFGNGLNDSWQRSDLLQGKDGFSANGEALLSQVIDEKFVAETSLPEESLLERLIQLKRSEEEASTFATVSCAQQETISFEPIEKEGAEETFSATASVHEKTSSSESITETGGTKAMLSVASISREEQFSKSSSNEDERKESPSRKSSTNKSDYKSDSSRPSSRPASRRSDRSQPASRPASRRTERPSSSKSETPPMLLVLPPVSRHKRKNLETSPAMLELFGITASSSPSLKKYEEKTVTVESATVGSKPSAKRVIVPAEIVQPFEVQKQPSWTPKTRKTGTKIRGLFERSEDSEPGPEIAVNISPVPNTSSSASSTSSKAENTISEYFEIAENGEMIAVRRKSSSQASSSAQSQKQLFDLSYLGAKAAGEKRRASEPGPEFYRDDGEIVGDEIGFKGDDKFGAECNEAVGIEDDERSSVRESEAHSAQSVSSTASEPPARDMSATASGSTIVIKGAQIVNDDSIFSADLLIEDNIIKQVSTTLSIPSSATVIEANGKLLLPAGIDVHTHFSAPNSVDNFHIGSKAALAGGTATIIDAVLPRDNESLLAACDRVRKAAEAQSLCNVGLSVVVSNWNDVIKKEMGLIVKDRGVNSFILDIHSDDGLYQAFEHCKTLGVLARIFPENKNIVSLLEKKMLALGVTGPEGYLQARPEMLEAEYIDRASILAQLTNCPLSVVGVSSVEARNAVMRSRSNALLFAEVAVAALASDGTHYFNKCIQHASAHLTKSPLRVDSRTSSLLIDCFASCPLCVCVSDHCGFRERGTGDFTHLALGVAAAEERMSILWEKAVYSGRIDPMRFVAITSSNAAKLFNLYPKKGRIAVGADADVVLWDPNMKRKFSAKTQQSRSEFSIFESQTVHSGPVLTICGGRLSYNAGKFEAELGSIVTMIPQSPYMFSIVQQRDKLTYAEKVNRDSQSNGLPRSQESSATRTPVTTRNQFESSLSSSGSYVEDNRILRASTKITNPPGGRSTGFW